MSRAKEVIKQALIDEFLRVFRDAQQDNGMFDLRKVRGFEHLTDAEITDELQAFEDELDRCDDTPRRTPTDQEIMHMLRVTAEGLSERMAQPQRRHAR